MVDIKGIANLLKGFRQNYSSGHFYSSTPSYAWNKASISCRNALFILRKQWENYSKHDLVSCDIYDTTRCYICEWSTGITSTSARYWSNTFSDLIKSYVFIAFVKVLPTFIGRVITWNGVSYWLSPWLMKASGWYNYSTVRLLSIKLWSARAANPLDSHSLKKNYLERSKNV